MTVMRVGEFAWSRMEPSEDHIDLDWLARAIRLAEKHHIAVVIGTPTDAPPAWLTTTYPETLRHRRQRPPSASTATAASSLTPAHITASSARASPRNSRDASATTPMSSAGKSATSTPTSPSTAATRAPVPAVPPREIQNPRLHSTTHWATAYWSQTYDRWDEIPLQTPAATPACCSTTATSSPKPGAASSTRRSKPFAPSPIRANSSPPTSAASAGPTIGTTTGSMTSSI